MKSAITPVASPGSSRRLRQAETLRATPGADRFLRLLYLAALIFPLALRFRDYGPTITAWLQVRVLPGPPRSRAVAEISSTGVKCPPLAGFLFGAQSLRRHTSVSGAA